MQNFRLGHMTFIGTCSLMFHAHLLTRIKIYSYVVEEESKQNKNMKNGTNFSDTSLFTLLYFV